jgi:hypothetical protein
MKTMMVDQWMEYTTLSNKKQKNICSIVKLHGIRELW